MQPWGLTVDLSYEINRVMLKSSLKSQKGVIHLLVLILILVGIVITTYLVLQRNLLFKSKAASDAINFKDTKGNPLPKESNLPVTDQPELKVELNPPQP